MTNAERCLRATLRAFNLAMPRPHVRRFWLREFMAGHGIGHLAAHAWTNGRRVTTGCTRDGSPGVAEILVEDVLRVELQRARKAKP